MKKWFVSVVLAVVLGCSNGDCRQLGFNDTQLAGGAGGVQQVMIETRFLLTRDNFMRDIGIDFRGLGDMSRDGGGFGGAGIANPGSNVIDSGLIGGTPGVDVLLNSSNLGFLPHVHSNGALGGSFVCAPGQGCIFVPDNLLQRAVDPGQQLVSRLIDVDTGFGGILGGAFLDDLQVQAILNAVDNDTQSDVLNAPQVTVFNDQRASISVLNQFANLQDVTDRVADAARAADARIEFLRDGVTLDIRPMINDNGTVTLQVRPAHALVADLVDAVDVNGQLQNVSLPIVAQSKLTTSIQLQSGQSVVLGGLILDDQDAENRSVPILGRVPFLSVLFRNSDVDTERRNLLVLITPMIVGTTGE